MRPHLVLLLQLLVIVISSVSQASPHGIEVVGFKSWKAQRIQEAQRTYFELYSEAQRLGAVASESKKDDLNQAKTNIQVARELTIEDYFALYFRKLSENRDKFAQALKQLSADELADLVLLYQKQLDRMEQEMGSKPPVVTGLAEPGRAGPKM